MADQGWTLSVEGAVRRPVRLSLDELRTLPGTELDASFHCVEGWTIPSGRWQGVTAREVLSLASPLPEARYVVAGAGAYTVLVPLAQLLDGTALLALERDGRPLAPGRDGPVRLVMSAGTCCHSVKQLDRLSLTVEAVPTSGERLSQARVAASPFRRAADVARGGTVDAGELAGLVDQLEALLPRELGSPGAAAVTAEALYGLLEQRFGSELPGGRRYLELLAPLKAELDGLLGEAAAAGGRDASWFSFVRRCAGVYTDATVPRRYRLLAHHWAGLAAAAACGESGAILVPPGLDGRPGAPFWLEF